MKPVLLLAETGIVIRNLLLGTFTDEILRVRPLVVAVPNPDDPRLRDVIAGKAITLVPYFLDIPPPAKTRLDRIKNPQELMYRFKLAEKATSEDDIEISMKYDGTPTSLIGRIGIRALLGTGKLIARAGWMRHLDDLFMRHIASRPTARRWVELIRDIDPAVVVSTTLTLCGKSRPSQDLQPVLAARSLGIPCGTLVQSWDNLTSKTSVLPPDLDRYWTWSGLMSAQLQSMYPRIEPDHVVVVGSPQFDFHQVEGADDRQTFIGGLGLDPARPVVLFGTGTPFRCPYEHLQVIELAEQLKLRAPHIQLLVRTHPKDDGTRWAELDDKIRSLGVVLQRTAPMKHMDAGGFVPPREFYREQVNALTHASVVVNLSSTLTVDASVLDRPVICIAYDTVSDPRWPEGIALMFSRSNHYGPLVRTGGVRVVTSVHACVDDILRYVNDPTLERAGRRKIVETVVGFADGGAGHRLANEVSQLAELR